MEIQNPIYHIPALLKESIDLLDVKPSGTYVDVTFGGGGHSREILRRLGPDGRLFSFDRDIDALQNVPDDPRITFIHSDYRFIRNFLRYHGVRKVDGIMADLGVSFHHFDTPERGFSFRSDAPLDMRMNRSGGRTASEIIRDIDARTLTGVIRAYTDLRRPADVAAAIISARDKAPVDTTFRLSSAVEPTLSPKNLKKELAQVFQAIRILTNREFESLQTLLSEAGGLLNDGGRFAVLTYHSGEDRMVKDLFRSGSPLGATQDQNALIFGTKKSPWTPVTRSPILPSDEEIEQNPRSRSAKLRVATYGNSSHRDSQR